MTPAAPLTPRHTHGPRFTVPARALRPAPCGVLLLASTWLLAPAPVAAQWGVERVDLSARIDPGAHALYAKASLVLRNRSREMLNTVELAFPAPLGSRIQVKNVWDRRGELPWRSDPVEAKEPRLLLMGLRAALPPGKKLLVVVSYDVDLQSFTVAKAALVLWADGARLETTGWYPLPTDSGRTVPRRLRLAIRLPKQWQVVAPVRIKQLRNGTALASYEVELNRVEPSQLLLRAGTAPPP